MRCSDARHSHDVFGERLRAFDTSSCCRWSEGGDPGLAQCVGDTQHERNFRADDDQIRFEGASQFGDRRTRGDIDGVLLGELRRSRITWSDQQLADLGVLAQSKEEGVLTSTGTYDEYAHSGQEYRLDPLRAKACSRS